MEEIIPWWALRFGYDLSKGERSMCGENQWRNEQRFRSRNIAACFQNIESGQIRKYTLMKS